MSHWTSVGPVSSGNGHHLDNGFVLGYTWKDTSTMQTETKTESHQGDFRKATAMVIEGVRRDSGKQK
jgi:hypothetical protein